MTSILFEDESFIAVDKPAGVLSVRGRLGEKEPSLLDQLAKARGEKLLIVHRLDRGTSGVLLFARDADAHRALNRSFEQGEVDKRYLALVLGEPPLPEFTIDVALVPARRGKARPASKAEPGKPATTTFRVLERLGGYALVEAHPHTGRVHQIRVHLKYAGFPLAVDALYSGAESIRRGELGLEPAGEVIIARTPLHARSLVVPHPRTKAPVTIEAPLPADIETALGLMRARTAAAKPGEPLDAR